MEQDAKIFVAGHRGLVGSALVRGLQRKGYSRLCLRTHAALDLTSQADTQAFFEAERPDYVFLAAGRVGGIHANQTYPAQFIRDNLAIASHVIHSAWQTGVRRLLYLGSSCIYPKLAAQPLREDSLLTGPLEASNRPYALAKIAGVELCWSYNREYGTQYLAVMPTNVYGPGDRYERETGHVIPALLRKFHDAKVRGDRQVTVWGTGTPLREFIYSEDMADACVFLMELPDPEFAGLLGSRGAMSEVFEPPLINIGSGVEFSIRELVERIQRVVGFDGEVVFDVTKPDGTPRKRLDVSRLHALGWRPTTSFDAGLRRTYEDLQQSLQAPASS